MGKGKLATILRCTGLALLVVGAFVLAPAAAQAGVCTAGFHGVSIFKSCVSPKNRCATDADCSDSDQCNGIEQCATEENPGSNVVECTITLANPAIHCDNMTILDASDAILNATGSGATSSTIQITGTSTGVVSGTCTAGTDLGGGTTCTIAPGGQVQFLANYYTTVPTDPSLLNDQATVNVQDTCSGGAQGCSTTPNSVQFTASTNTVSGCSPGSPLNCDDGLFCTDDSCVPATGCAHVPHPCADSNLCTTDTCHEDTNGCQFTPVTCQQDSNLCTLEACDPADGVCKSGAPTTCADDGNACNGPESCDTATGGCVSGPPLNCDDGLFCTDDSCDPATGCAHSTHDCDDADQCTIDSCNEDLNQCDHAADPACNPVGGRMTGGGSIFTKAGGRVTHGFELHCDPEVGPNNLEINWGGGNHFHLENLLTAICTDDPAIAPRPPSADFDTYNGTGTGSCNGVEGATITFVLTDAGEPGKKDFASFEITGCPGGLTLSVSGNLNKGNQQAHKQ